MKDYALHIKIKNNYLLTMMRQYSITTATELSRESGVRKSGIGEILNLKTPAYTSRGEITSDVKKLCNFFQCSPSDIFPEQHLQESLPVNKVVMEANVEDLVPMYARLGSQDPLDLLLEQEQEEIEHNALAAAASTLTQNQQDVLKLRFGVDTASDESSTLAQTAEIMGRSPERIRQIQKNALRLMLHPSRGLHNLR